METFFPRFARHCLAPEGRFLKPSHDARRPPAQSWSIISNHKSMQSRCILIFCGLLAGYPAMFHGQDEEPSFTGYVTRAASGSDFDVNGIHIQCGGVPRGAHQPVYGVKQSAVGCPCNTPFIGEKLIVDGFQSIVYDDPKRHVANFINATGIESEQFEPREISGSAVIDASPVPEATGAQAPELLVRADGYRIRISGKTTVKWDPPLQSLADVKAGNWIRYKGNQDSAGVLVAASVKIGPNVIGNKEEALRAKKEYDPSAVPAEARQNFLKDGFAGGCRGSYLMGCDPKRFPPFNDAAMQARIDKIGNSLVTAYQRTLPDSDPAKIGFRFQLIDTKLFRDALTMPSGIILVPHQVVERIENDSQLAAVLADAIARALERQQYREQGKQKAAMASMLGGAFVPYTGGGIALEGAHAEGGILTYEQQQSGRVSLTLLHDAGYDIDQAPLAWWLLDPGKPEPLSEIEIPDRAAYLYRILGEIWHNPASNAQKPQGASTYISHARCRQISALSSEGPQNIFCG